MTDNASSPPARSIPWWYFSIVLVPIAVFLSHEVIVTTFLPGDMGVTEALLIDGRDWLEGAGRYRFLAASWFFCAIALFAVCVVIRTLWGPMTQETRTAALTVLAFITGLGILPNLGGVGSDTGLNIYNRIGAPLYEGMMERGTLRGCKEVPSMLLGSACMEPNPVAGMFRRVMFVINICAGLSVGALIVGMILCLDASPRETIDARAAQLADNLTQMRMQLYLAGVVLTFGMFFAASWIYWPLNLVIDAERARFSALLLANALFVGTFFTLLILSFYLPVALILDARVKALAREAAGEGSAQKIDDLAKWRTARGLSASAGDHMRAGFALAGPILAAFAGGVSPFSF